MRVRLRFGFLGILWSLAICSLILQSCEKNKNALSASIEFTRVPQADPAGGSQTEIIAGQAKGADSRDRVVIYALAGTWWVQPLEAEPWTDLNPRSRWITSTHLGTKYAALLVGPGFKPPSHLSDLPALSESVKAKAVVTGAAKPPSPYLTFSGYRWRTRNTVSNRGGTNNKYESTNEWTDQRGSLHLQINGGPTNWTCAEVALTQSLGYGTYSFDLSDTSQLEPSVVFAFFTYDYAGGDANHREANFEISRWGDPSIKNGQFVVQPFHVAENVSRFVLPSGPTTNSLDWGPGRMSFRTTTRDGKAIAQHVFISGIPRPGLESPRIAFYVYNGGIQKQLHPVEIVVDNFKYLP